MSADLKKKFRNIILCEDIREEIGNKKSLIGVLAGDILTGAFPAHLSLAIYFEYLPDESDGDEFAADFRLWRGDTMIVHGACKAPIEPDKIVTIVLPRGLAYFDAESRFRMTISLKGQPELELLNKKVSV